MSLTGAVCRSHLFDIDIKGGQKFKESDTLTPGDSYTVFDTEFGRAGLAICFDLRFPELFRMMALAGAECVFVPAAFNDTTGPLHWELLFRARAVDSQCFLFGTSDARDGNAAYRAYGHSIAVDPWGKVLGMLDEKPGILVTGVETKKSGRPESRSRFCPQEERTCMMLCGRRAPAGNPERLL